MPQVRMRSATYSVEHGRLAAGQLVQVDDEDVARRWLKNGLAVDPADKAAQAAIGQTTEALQSEVDRLTAEIARLQSGQGEEASLPAESSPYGDHADELADLGLTEQQRTNLQRAGFGTRRALHDASDDDLLDVGGIGAATITRLREAAGTGGDQSEPFGTDAGAKAITRGPGGR